MLRYTYISLLLFSSAEWYVFFEQWSFLCLLKWTQHHKRLASNLKVQIWHIGLMVTLCNLYTEGLLLEIKPG
jgi:hypothetical protein